MVAVHYEPYIFRATASRGKMLFTAETTHTVSNDPISNFTSSGVMGIEIVSPPTTPRSGIEQRRTAKTHTSPNHHDNVVKKRGRPTVAKEHDESAVEVSEPVFEQAYSHYANPECSADERRFAERNELTDNARKIRRPTCAATFPLLAIRSNA
jgi:hypothetical protein